MGPPIYKYSKPLYTSKNRPWELLVGHPRRQCKIYYQERKKEEQWQKKNKFMKVHNKLIEINLNILIMILNINGLIYAFNQDERREGKVYLIHFKQLENQKKYMNLWFLDIGQEAMQAHDSKKRKTCTITPDYSQETFFMLRVSQGRGTQIEPFDPAVFGRQRLKFGKAIVARI